MKQYIVNNFESLERGDDHTRALQRVLTRGGDDMTVSDGYHTMDELYDHRIAIFMALCKEIAKAFANDETDKKVWRSLFHSDGSCFEGWFVLGINKEKGDQITYHLPMKEWPKTLFAETFDRAPEWDGHTAQDVLNRLKNF